MASSPRRRGIRSPATRLATSVVAWAPCWALCSALLVGVRPAFAQQRPHAQRPLAQPLLARRASTPRASAPEPLRRAAPTYDSTLFATLKWREIGPMRGGRSVAVAGSGSRPYEYWFGTTGGGVFKTTDGGITWTPATDKYFGGTIGAIGVAESNPDIVYVGTGEYPIRGNVSPGEGVWKTTDGGKTWTFLGLEATRQISRIRVHPTNPDIAYVGAQGNFAVPSSERGVFKTTDGGKTWRKVLFRNDSSGITDLVLDPNNPQILYAAFWQSYRTPWSLSSGGAGSGIFKSTDGGETWTELTRNAGLPTGIWGNIGITVSGATSNRLWALIEADSGGVFRSDDGGQTWTRTNEDRKLRQRAWYYTRIFADPKDSHVVYALNTGFYRSTDDGKTFKAVAVPHGDNHDLWIASNDPKRMIEANDGGANVTFNGGRSWSEQDYATAQFYHVVTTTDFPYRVCGAQQDNSTICIASRAPGGIDLTDWEPVGGGESGYIAVRPDKTNIVFAGSYGGLLTRFDTRTRTEKAVNPWPDNPMGYSAEDIKYRFQWTYPIIISPHDPNVLYATAQVVFRSLDEGQSWHVVSPDLTRHDPKTLGPSGGPITKDQTGVETYATIFTLAESPVTAGVLWAGSDDGLVHVSRDNGQSWTNVTPKDIGDFTRISIIDPSPHAAGAAYLAANRYQLGDYGPILYKTTDYGRTWTRIVNGIPAHEFTRVIREDPVRKGLLFAGTERGVWVSFDDGANWQRLQLNLPKVPVHDLDVRKDGDVVAATHGRAFWILDDISPLRQLTAEIASRPVHLFTPRDAYHVQFGGGFGEGRGPHPVGKNPPDGVVIHYVLGQPKQEVTLDLLDGRGTLIRRFTSRLDSLGLADSVRADSIRTARLDSLKAIGKPMPQPDTTVMAAEEQQPDFEETMRRGPRPQRVPNKAGLNTFIWDMRYPDAVRFGNLIMWAAGTTGPRVAPGTYHVRLTVAGQPAETRSFRILEDPRSTATQADLEAQVALLLKIRDRTSDANNAVRTIRNVKAQLHQRVTRAPSTSRSELERAAQSLADRLSTVEGEIYQVRNQSSQDPLNYPIKLNNKIAALSGVVASADGRPTAQSYAVFAMLSAQLDRQLSALHGILDTELPRVNQLVVAAGLPKIVPSTAEVPPERRVAASGRE